MEKYGRSCTIQGAERHLSSVRLLHSNEKMVVILYFIAAISKTNT